MKSLKNLFALIACAMLAVTAFTGCEWDDSPEPDHPLYVTYTISASVSDFTGSDALLLDINKWIKANQKIYDKQVNYSTGAASEFAQTDADAIKIYESFVPKFKAYLEEVRGQLAKGVYEPDSKTNASFYVYAARTQGEGGNIKTELVTLVYPPVQ